MGDFEIAPTGCVCVCWCVCAVVCGSVCALSIGEKFFLKKITPHPPFKFLLCPVCGAGCVSVRVCVCVCVCVFQSSRGEKRGDYWFQDVLLMSFQTGRRKREKKRRREREKGGRESGGGRVVREGEREAGLKLQLLKR